MTDRELMQEALDALTYVGDAKDIYSDTIDALRARLAQPERKWVGLTYADLYFWGGELGLGELGKGVLRAVDVHLREKNS